MTQFPFIDTSNLSTSHGGLDFLCPSTQNWTDLDNSEEKSASVALDEAFSHYSFSESLTSPYTFTLHTNNYTENIDFPSLSTPIDYRFPPVPSMTQLNYGELSARQTTNNDLLAHTVADINKDFEELQVQNLYPLLTRQNFLTPLSSLFADELVTIADTLTSNFGMASTFSTCFKDKLSELYLISYDSNGELKKCVNDCDADSQFHTSFDRSTPRISIAQEKAFEFDIEIMSMDMQCLQELVTVLDSIAPIGR